MASAKMRSEALSAIMIVGALVLHEVSVGMIEASTVDVHPRLTHLEG